MNLASLLDEAARRLPERTALVFPERGVRYGELERAVLRCAAGLAARGVGRGDRVALLDDASPLHVATVLAAAHLGAAAVPMHAQLTARELGEVARASDCGPVGVAGAAHAERLVRAVAGPVLGEAELLSGPDPGILPERVHDPKLACVVLLTSGTSGLPKPVAISHDILEPRLRGFAGTLDPDRPVAVSLTCVPLVHIGGLGGVLTSLAGGGTTVVQRRFDAGEWLRLAERHRVTSTFLVPTLLRRLLDHPDFDRTDLSALRMVSYGAAAAPVPMVEEMIRRFPRHVAFSNVFGQTETTGAISGFGPEDHRLDARGHLVRAGSVGRAFPGVEIRIVDPESGADLPRGEVGELWVRSAFNAEPGWRRTGDLVRQDADGYLYPAGRLSDTINRGGEKFGPAEIESVLRQHPAVADAAVAGVPDPELGERVGAAVVRRGSLDEEELRAHCRAHLARFKVPERIAFVDEIPYTAQYKVSRKQIAELILDRSEP